MEINSEEFRHEMSEARAEVCELTAQFLAWRLNLGERVTKLETHDQDVSGNGQPGRLAKLEMVVIAMGNKFAAIAGMGTLIGVLAALAGWLWPRH